MAPLTMSTSALWAEIVSCTSTGRASSLISRSRLLPSGYCTTSTALILPSASVSRTWTGPHLVCATAPVTVEPPAGATAWVTTGAGPDVEVW